MLSRTIKKSVLDIRLLNSALPPIFLFPSRARYFNSTAQIIDPPADDFQSIEEPLTSKIVASSPSALKPHRFIPPPNSSATTKADFKSVSDSVKQLLPLLLAQPSYFITAHIHARPYLVTPGDIIRLPFHMPDVAPGDVLRLNRASIIGSRDYTLKGTPYLDERIFECRARVIGTEGEPVRVKEKTKQRNRRVKTVRSKHKFTVIRISELKIKSLEEIENENS